MTIRLADSAFALAVDESDVSLMDDETTESSDGEVAGIVDEEFAKDLNLYLLGDVNSR